MEILAKAQKLIPLHMAAKSEPGRAVTDPLTGDVLTFAVVVTHAKMLLKILLCILEVVLGFRGKHESQRNLIDQLF
jgi:hypothetical protein